MIPKIIHYCWVGGNPLPKSAQKCIKSWKKYCPDYEIIEWNESNYDFTKNQYMKEAYEAKKWGFVPDYARLDIVYQHGGIYLDVDVEIVKPFDPLLSYAGFAGFEVPEFVALGLGFGAEPGNSKIKKMRDAYDEIHFLNEDGTYNTLPSPHINTETAKGFGLACNGSFQVVDDFAFLPMDYLSPKSFITGEINKTKNTYSIHHFEASWMTDEQIAHVKSYGKSIKRNRRKDRLDRLIHTPNRVLIKIMGNERYERIKKYLQK